MQFTEIDVQQGGVTDESLIFKEVHILHILRLLNKHCVKRKTLSLKKDTPDESILVQLKADGEVSEHFENLLRRICLLQDAHSVKIDRDQRVDRGLSGSIQSYQIEIRMPRLEKPIDVTKAMIVGDVDFFNVAASQELVLEQQDQEGLLFQMMPVDQPRTLQ